jgi:hypothetical protein
MILGALILLVGCGDGNAPSAMSVEVRDSAGIAIVTNRIPPSDTVRLASPTLRIGSADLNAAENELFELISDVEVDGDGNVYIVDNRGARIAVFAADGTWLSDIGNPGRGPGEYQAPIRLRLRGDTLFVWDAILRRLNRFTTEGSFLGAVTLADRSAGHPIVPVRQGFVDELEWGQNVDPAPAEAVLVVRDREGVIADTVVGPYAVPEIGWEWADEDHSTGMMVNPPVFAVRPPWAVREDEIVWAQPVANEIEFRDIETGGLRRLVRLVGQTARPTVADREAYVDALISAFDMDATRRTEMLESTTFAPERPTVATLLVDDERRIWVADHDPSKFDRNYTGSSWTVLDSDGAVQIVVRFPDSFELMTVSGGNAYGITRTTEGVEVVEVFRLPGRLEEAWKAVAISSRTWAGQPRAIDIS